jgi:hypothetical protein
MSRNELDLLVVTRKDCHYFANAQNHRIRKSRPCESGSTGVHLMDIPRFWSKFEYQAQNPRGKLFPIVCWRGSSTSRNEAQALARAAAERMAQRIGRGESFPERYTYPGRPLREEILQEFSNQFGDMDAALTRNAYGAEVLNAANLLFIDIDLPAPKAPGILSRLLRRGRETPKSDAAISAAKRCAEWLGRHPEWGMRIYRTRSGLRYLITHALFQPGAAESEIAMEFLGCDPQYLQLCRIQKSFRARLTPKPWRCGCRRPLAWFPFETDEQKRQMRAWEAEYEEACRSWATCALVEILGSRQVHPALNALVKLHDDRTRSDSGLSLA